MYRELHNTTEYLLIYVVFQNRNFAVVISNSLFKTGKSGTQWYCVIHGMFSVPWFCIVNGTKLTNFITKVFLNSKLITSKQFWTANLFDDMGFPWSLTRSRKLYFIYIFPRYLNWTFFSLFFCQKPVHYKLGKF